MIQKFVADRAACVTSGMLTLLRNRVPQKLSREEIRFAQISFSQFGEDLAVMRWAKWIDPASKIYVDAGCFHPVMCSNTLLLHKTGWKGVNIDAEAKKIKEFDTLRPGDVNVCSALSDHEAEVTFYTYQEGGLTNRLAAIDDPDALSAIGEQPVSSTTIRTRTLNSVLAQMPWPVPSIGYLNIDCEGHDLTVLRGLNLERYAPAIITIEALSADETTQTIDYLTTRNYVHRETIHRTLLFTRPS